LRKLRKKLVLTRKDAKEREERRNNNNNEYDKNNQRNKKNKKGKNNDDDDEDDKKGKSQGSIGDVSIVQNIHLLFARAKRKCQSDLTWHLQHAEFAKEAKSFLMLGRIYSEALQVRLWIWIGILTLSSDLCVCSFFTYHSIYETMRYFTIIEKTYLFICLKCTTSFFHLAPSTK
jgi:hypothetical protein